jgi:hypothetical protein
VCSFVCLCHSCFVCGLTVALYLVAAAVLFPHRVLCLQIGQGMLYRFDGSRRKLTYQDDVLLAQETVAIHTLLHFVYFLVLVGLPRVLVLLCVVVRDCRTLDNKMSTGGCEQTSGRCCRDAL